MQRFREWLGEPVDGDGVGFFRLCFGLLGFYPIYRFLAHKPGWTDPARFNFPLVEIWPFDQPAGWVLCLAHAAMALGALGITLGCAARASALLYLLAYGYHFLLEQSDYNNHYYLICLLAFIFACIGGDRFLAWPGRGPTLPRWHLLWLRGQVMLVYFYGGLAKIGLDWLNGNPLRTWVAQRNPSLEHLGLAMAHAGMFLDLLMPLGLILRATRPWAIALGAFFHLSNSYLFSIGVFPWMMLASFVLFLEPGQLRRRPVSGPQETPSSLVICGLAVYALWQLLFPFRHHAYPGNVDWTAQAAHFSWRMKLIDRQGEAVFTVEDGGKRWLIYPEDELTREQARNLATHPSMVVRYARHLRQRYLAQGGTDPVVTARVSVSINGWPHQLLLDPQADLGRLRLGPLDANPHLLSRESVLPASPWLTRTYAGWYLTCLCLGWLWGPPLRAWRACLVAQAGGLALALAGPLEVGLALAALALLAAAGVAWRSPRPGVTGLFCLYQAVWLRILWVVSHPDSP